MLKLTVPLTPEANETLELLKNLTEWEVVADCSALAADRPAGLFLLRNRADKTFGVLIRGVNDGSSGYYAHLGARHVPMTCCCCENEDNLKVISETAKSLGMTSVHARKWGTKIIHANPHYNVASLVYGTVFLK